MRIAGLQKLTLLDYPGKLACTVFLPGCNLRCPFCHNAALVLPEAMGEPVMDTQGLLSFLESRKGKLDGVCITGGEPTLHRQLPQFIDKIRDLGFLVKLDTNGTDPEMLGQLLDEGMLDYVAMDIKNSPEKYARTVGGMDVLENVRKSVRILMDSGVEYELRTTVMHPYHTVEDMRAIGQWLQGARAYYLQQFVDSGGLIGSAMEPLNKEEMQALRDAVLAWIPNTHIRGR